MHRPETTSSAVHGWLTKLTRHLASCPVLRAGNAPRWDQRQGASLLSLMIGIGIALFTVMTLQAAALNAFIESSRAKGRQDFMQVEELVRQTLVAKLIPIIEPLPEPRSASCITFPASFNAAWPTSFASLNFSMAPLGAADVDTTPSGYQPLDAAKSRCATNQTFSSAAFSSTSAGFYVCFQLTSSLSPPPADSIFSAGPVLAEVAYGFRDIQTDAPIDCGSYTPAITSIRGTSAYYTLYWQKRHGNRTFSYRHTGSIHATNATPW